MNEIADEIIRQTLTQPVAVCRQISFTCHMPSHTTNERRIFNPLLGTLKPQSNGPLYSNTVIGTLAVDGWAVTLVQRGGGWRAGAPPSPLISVRNVTAHPSTASVPTSYYLV